MSLRLKLIALFAAILAATMGVTAWLAGRIVHRSIETEIRDRTFERGRALDDDLRREPRYDPDIAEDLLTQLLRSHRGLNAGELHFALPGADTSYRIQLTPSGPEREDLEGPAVVPARASAELLDDGGGRRWRVSMPVQMGAIRAQLVLEGALTEVERLVIAERRVFLWGSAAACAVLIFALNLVLMRLIGRPIGSLVRAMHQAEGGQLDVRVMPRTHDELAVLALGFNRMIERLGGFSRELQEKVDQAVADLARKNRDLAELNDLLVAARRDLVAKERLAALGQLAGTLAHELGNPLNAVSGNVQLIARNPELPEPVRADLKIVQAEIARMTGIIRRFLDSTRATTPAPESVDVTALLRETLDLTVTREARSNLEVRFEVDPALGAVQIDPGLVRHVLTNFVANAVDAMGGRGALTLGARRVGDELLLSVADSGPGIAPEQRKHLFEPFYTTKPLGRGTGLGLAICREIARALKGRVEVESEPGAGATFTLVVPLAAARVRPVVAS